MFGEQDQFLSGRRNRTGNRPGAIWESGFLRNPAGDGCRGEDLVQQTGEFAPLLVLAAPAHCERERFQAFQRLDLGLQLGDRAGRGGLVENLLLDGFDFVVGGIFEILDVFVRPARRSAMTGATSAPRWSSSSSRSRFPGVPPAPERLVDGLRRRR